MAYFTSAGTLQIAPGLPSFTLIEMRSNRNRAKRNGLAAQTQLPPQKEDRITFYSMQRTVELLPLVVASPGGVNAERAIVETVAAELIHTLAADRNLRLDVIRWLCRRPDGMAARVCRWKRT